MSKRLAAFYLLPALAGCEDVCDVDALRSRFAGELGPAAAASALAEACEAPPSLDAWLENPSVTPAAEIDAVWRLACPEGPDLVGVFGAPRLPSRRAVFQGCGLQAAGGANEEDFVHAEGFPFLAITVGAWLRSVDVEADVAHFVELALLGTPLVAFPGGSPRLPAAVDAAPIMAMPDLVVLHDKVYVRGAPVLDASAIGSALAPDGDPWRLKAVVDAAGPAPHEWIVAADRDTSVHALYRVASSLVPPGGSVRILGLTASEDWYGTVGLQIADAGASTVRVTGTAFEVRLPGGVSTFARTEPLGAKLAELPEGQAVTISFTDDAQLDDLLAVVAQVPAGHAAALAPGPAPCAKASVGMLCVAGGTTSLKAGPVTVEVPTFYIDAEEVTVESWQACVQGKSCPKVATSTADPKAAMTGLTWDEADLFCTWAGKRLPTEWEAARAAEAATGLIGAKAGAAEWTDTWFEGSLETCGASCSGLDPRGPCDAATPCAGHDKKAVRGGEGSRSGLAKRTRSPTVGVRCATSRPWRTQFPPLPITEVPPDSTALSPEQVELVRGIVPDPIWEKPRCEGDWGTVSLSCRDPLTYVKSNEGRSWVMAPYIRNRGGAYVGVGSDQNYTFASLARSQIVWLFDYDPDVVALHMVNRALTMASDSPKAFAARWAPGSVKESLAIIAAAYKDHPEREYFLAHYRHFQPQLHTYYAWLTQPSGRLEETQWLRNLDQYAYVRKLWETGRMYPVKGDLMGKNAMHSIAETCVKLGVPMRVMYTSNAPDVWNGRLVEGYRRNVVGLPTDEQSIMVQSFRNTTGYAGYSGTPGPWHFNVQSLSQHQELMSLPGYSFVRQLVARRLRTDDVDLTLSGLRSD